MLIDCDSCAVRNLACGDCVVTVLLGMPAPATAMGDVQPGQAQGLADSQAQACDQADASHISVTRVELDNPERAAIAVLAAHGLVPPLRLVPKDRADDAREAAERGDAGGDAGGDAQAAAG